MSYIYIMTNIAMPGLVKIGMTEREPYERAKELSTTGVPGKFQVEEYWDLSEDEFAYLSAANNTKGLLKTEKAIHKALGKYRYQANREFFEISLDEARKKVTAYFKRQSTLERKRLKEAKERELQEQCIKEASEAKERLNQLLINGVTDFITQMNETSDLLEGKLETVLPIQDAITTLAQHPLPDQMKGTVSGYGRWEMSASYSYTNNAKRHRALQTDNAKVYIFGGAEVKRFLKDPEYRDAFFSVNYDLHSGKLADRKGQGHILNQAQMVFPSSLKDFLVGIGANDLAYLWEDTFGNLSEMKSKMKSGLECPACKRGTLVERHRKRDLKSFLGCSTWPECSFTFDTPVQSPDAIAQALTPHNVKQDTIQQSPMQTQKPARPVPQLSEASNNSVEHVEADSPKKSGGISVFWIILGVILFLKLIAVSSRG